MKDLFEVIPLKPLRHTPGVWFDLVPASLVKEASGVDRVVHHHGALSPGPVEGVERPWYMHQAQEDHLLVMHGARTIDLYSQAHGRVEQLVAKPESLRHGGEIIHEGPYILKWFRRVFHRIVSDAVQGSASLNFATRYPDFDILTNFSIYELDEASGSYTVIREGHLDQPPAINASGGSKS